MLTRKTILVALLAVATGAGAWIMFSSNGADGEKFLTVRAGDFEQAVSVSGKVIPAESLQLSFEQSGAVTAVPVEVGTRVGRGELLVSQDTSELAAQLAETRAAIEVEKAKLQQLLAGSSAEDIQITETAVANAKIDLENAKQSFRDAEEKTVDTLKDSYTKADDAVRGKTDQLFVNPRGNDPQLSLGTPVGGQLETDVEWRRSLLEKTVTDWSAAVGKLSTLGDLSAELSYAKKNLRDTALFL
ncbi:MAG: biotin/lipoyl-binding protein, partial [Patescibacteria group bacterium]